MTSGSDSGDSSCPAAVEAANAALSIDKTDFAPGLVVKLLTEVVYTGGQDLKINVLGLAVSGAIGDAATNSTYDGGLFVSESASDLKFRNIPFVDSFNNGVAVFLPQSGGAVEA